MARGSLFVLASVALLAGGCSMLRGEKKAEFKPVSDADFGRLQPQQMGPVDGARSAVFAARDEVARSKLRLQQAENEVEMARADQTAARANKQRSAAETDAASKSQDPYAKAAAQEASARAELQTRSAQGHMAFAQRLVAAREAELSAAEQQVKLREAELEKAKFTALSQAGIPAATKYNPSTFDAHVAGVQQEYAQRKAEADQRFHEARQVENTWRTLHAQYEQRVRAQSATGTGATGGPAAPPPASP